jgi:hypothetical protein
MRKRVNPLGGKTTDWRAGCGRTACPVRREGEPKPIDSSYPYNLVSESTPHVAFIIINPVYARHYPRVPPRSIVANATGGRLPAFRALKRTAKFTPSLRDEEGAHFMQKFG